VSASHSWNLLVFRDGRRVLDGRDLLRTLRQKLEGVSSLSDFRPRAGREELIEALLRSGELECALADHPGCERAAETLGRLTDQLALALVEPSSPRLSSLELRSLSGAEVPEHLLVSTPEGFCYYALHPLDYTDLLNSHTIEAPVAAVVGIRSIGTTLSAVVRAWFELHGTPAYRITVRPGGPPFDRTLSLSEGDRRWVGNRIQQGASFLVVDEGPGLSGSSFLAVAESLVQAGVPPSRIVLLPSSSPNFSSLLAPDAAARWSRFRTIPLSSTARIPSAAAQDIGWGNWRRVLFDGDEEWCGVWAWTERRKFLSGDKRVLFRFEGYGHYGNQVRDRSQILANGGWGPTVSSAGDGFSAYPWIAGGRPRDIDRGAVLQLASYCAFRQANFRLRSASGEALEQMTEVNLERALGVSASVVLPMERPVIADARMMPCEWVRAADGRLLKVDAASHGDDHFYPGPTDIAWDIAGAIIEWKLDRGASDLLIAEYQRISGDSIKRRLPAYLLAYCAFRLGFTLSAARSVSEAKEIGRFQREAEGYQARLATLLSLVTAA